MAGSSPQRALLPWMDKVVDRLAAVAMSEPGKAFAGARLFLMRFVASAKQVSRPLQGAPAPTVM
jgi:hypothetical protein